MIDLDKENFESEVLQAQGPVLVDFYSDGCVPCQALTPHIHGFEEKYGGKLKFTSLNITKARRLAIAQKVLGLPVVAIYSGAEKIDELVKDDATPENIEAMIQKHVS
ncbi:MAG TPA: thioredoxin family protein [Clostridia bacterium]|nr:thioredoxin family protein [Clostridia bacterium]